MESFENTFAQISQVAPQNRRTQILRGLQPLASLLIQPVGLHFKITLEPSTYDQFTEICFKFFFADFNLYMLKKRFGGLCGVRSVENAECGK